jgi:FMN phosphatase YigB (HAD superfamily)
VGDGETDHVASRPREGFRGILFDWRGTLVVAPTHTWLVRTALERLGREASPAAVDAVRAQLLAADHTRVDDSAIDVDAAVHHAAYLAWFAAAQLDPELAAALYEVESDPSANDFAADAGPVLWSLHQAGVRIGVLSDIHVDIRPAFAARTNPGGGTFADLVHTWVLSYEVGVAKPDPAVFDIALQRLGLSAEDVLMVGDRGAWDGAAAATGIVTILLPPLKQVTDLRLHRVLHLAVPGLHQEQVAPGPLPR